MVSLSIWNGAGGPSMRAWASWASKNHCMTDHFKHSPIIRKDCRKLRSLVRTNVVISSTFPKNVYILFSFFSLVFVTPTLLLNSYTLKTPGSEIDPERVHWGQTPCRVKDDPEISQLDAECDPELDQSDPISCQVCRKLTNFRVIFDSEFGPNGPFSGSRWPGCF